MCYRDKQPREWTKTSPRSPQSTYCSVAENVELAGETSRRDWLEGLAKGTMTALLLARTATRQLGRV